MNSRLLNIKNKLKEHRLDAALVSSVPNIIYLTGYSGFSEYERGAFLLITTNEQYILTDNRYKDELYNVIPNLCRHEMAKPLGGFRDLNFELEEVSSSIPYRVALEKLIAKHKIKKLGIEVNDLKVSEYISIKKIFKNKSPLTSFEISENRILKEQKEIESIEKACKLTDQTFEYILNKINPGITEKELAFEIEYFIKKNGGDLAFDSIVAFGKHSAVPHHKVTSEILKQVQDDKNENIILLDFGAKVDNYCSDMTRVVFLGKATDEQKKVYKIVLEAQKRAIGHINSEFRIQNSELKAADADKAAHDYIKKEGFGENIFHSLGHGVGLEIHEDPRLSTKSKAILKPNMVFTIEPGIYLPNKFGVRIEDLAVLEKSGLRLLSRSPKNIIEL